MIKYPNLKKVNKEEFLDNELISKSKNLKKANLGLSLEADISETNTYYLNNNLAVIYKKPTPIQIVRVNYLNKRVRITDAFFKEPSTTDYNGLYNGYYLDFDVKETTSKTSFPLANIKEHQLKHLKKVYEHFGISFLIINFKALNEYYLCPYIKIASYFEGPRKSIPYREFKSNFYEIPYGFKPRIDYLKVIKDNLVNLIKPR